MRTEEGKLYMFVAIDRTSKFAFVELHEKATRRVAGDFLRRLAEAAPYKIHTVLTDNGTHFTDPAGADGPSLRSRKCLPEQPDLAAAEAPVRPRPRHLEMRLQAVEAEIDALIGADPGLAARRDILMSIPGISDVTATALLIEAPELGTLEPGQWTGRAAIRGGRAPLRRALYMPALAAARHNPDLKTVYDRLIAAGKPPKLALTALMRKLVILANAFLRDGRKWAPNTA